MRFWQNITNMINDYYIAIYKYAQSMEYETNARIPKQNKTLNILPSLIMGCLTLSLVVSLTVLTRQLFGFVLQLVWHSKFIIHEIA